MDALAVQLEDPAHPGFIKLDALKTLTLFHSLNKSSSNHQALTSFYSQNNNNISDYHLLRSELVKQNSTILSTFGNNTPPSEQNQAYIAKTVNKPNSKYGAKQPGKTHCNTCYNATKNNTKWINGTQHIGPFHFYHPESNCKRKSAFLADLPQPPAQSSAKSKISNFQF